MKEDKKARFIAGFNSYVCEGDSIAIDCNGLTFIATIHNDEDSSIDYADCYSQEAIDNWKNGLWHFIGVAVSVFCGDNQLTNGYGASLWGLEANISDNHEYLLEVANELLPDAIEEAKEAVKKLTASLNAINWSE